MKHLFISLAALITLGACQTGAEEKTAANAPASTTETAVATDPQSFTTIQWIDSARNLGTMAEGQKIEISFKFRNSGSKPLVIKDVQPSCGCTVADFPKEPLAPGQEGIIKGVFDSSGKPGKNTKTMTVFANTEGSQQHFLSFTVDVTPKKS
jgi:hypothetical protein